MLGNSTYDPAELLEQSNPSEYLLDLAHKAGISPEQISQLLESFKVFDTPQDESLVAMLEKLRQAYG